MKKIYDSNCICWNVSFLFYSAMDKLQNPFASGGGTTTSTTPQSTPSDDFLSFSASTPDESRKKRGHFKDRGKPNNLRNAGHFENFRGTPRGSPYPSQRGWNGGGRGGWRGGGGTPQNQPWFTPPRCGQLMAIFRFMALARKASWQILASIFVSLSVRGTVFWAFLVCALFGTF